MNFLFLSILLDVLLLPADAGDGSGDSSPASIRFQLEDGRSGVIFSYPLPSDYIYPEKGRWTPSVKQVKWADSLVLVPHFKQLGGYADTSYCTEFCPVDAKNWFHYHRQVFGVIKANEDSLLRMSYFLKEDTARWVNWETQRVNVIGSCRVWYATVNLSSQQSVFDYPEIVCY